MVGTPFAGTATATLSAIDGVEAFTGRDDVLDSTRHRIEGNDGFLEVRLGDGRSAALFLIDT